MSASAVGGKEKNGDINQVPYKVVDRQLLWWLSSLEVISFHNIIDNNIANLCPEVAVKMCAPNQLLTAIFALLTIVNFKVMSFILTRGLVSSDISTFSHALWLHTAFVTTHKRPHQLWYLHIFSCFVTTHGLCDYTQEAPGAPFLLNFCYSS